MERLVRRMWVGVWRGERGRSSVKVVRGRGLNFWPGRFESREERERMWVVGYLWREVRNGRAMWLGDGLAECRFVNANW